MKRGGEILSKILLLTILNVTIVKYKYSNAIDAKGEQFSTESLIMSLLLEQYKLIS